MLNAETSHSETLTLSRTGQSSASAASDSLDLSGLSGSSALSALSSLPAQASQSGDQNAAFSALLDQAFGLTPGHHYLDDFPVWNAAYQSPNTEVLGAFVKGQLAASAAMRIVMAKTLLGDTLPLAVIGAVATEPHYRGQGHASRLVTDLTHRAAQSGARLAVLWSGEREFYTRLGFEPCGNQARVVLEDLTLPVPAQKELQDAVYEGWTPALFELIRKRPCGLLLADGDRPWYQAHRNVRWFFTGTPDNPTAYLALGRGIDLKGHIHEWGGAPQSLIQILAYLKKTSPNLVLLGHPDLLKNQLGIDVSSEQIEEMCLAKNLTATPLSSELRQALWIWGLDAA